MSVPAIAMIAAIGENRVIGDHGAIPWRLPSDFAYFKRTTLGKPVVMGRKTFESIGKPLAGRANIVVTRQADYQPEGVEIVRSLDAALDRAAEIASADAVAEVMVCGGAKIYAEAMPLADRLYITHVALSPEGDAVFPTIDPAIWELVATRDIPRTERDSAEFAARVYERRGGSAR